MHAFEVTVFIKLPQQEIFAFTSNPDNDRLWIKDLVSSEWISPDPVGVGSAKRAVSKFLGRNTSVTVEYTIWDPPNMYRVNFDFGPFSLQGTTKFEPQENGTRVTLTGQVKAPGILKLVEGTLAKQAKAQDGKNLETLKRIMEAHELNQDCSLRTADHS